MFQRRWLRYVDRNGHTNANEGAYFRWRTSSPIIAGLAYFLILRLGFPVWDIEQRHTLIGYDTLERLFIRLAKTSPQRLPGKQKRRLEAHTHTLIFGTTSERSSSLLWIRLEVDRMQILTTNAAQRNEQRDWLLRRKVGRSSNARTVRDNPYKLSGAKSIIAV